MGRPSNIPEKFVIPMLEQWEGGMNAAQIVDWLKVNHNVETTVSSVNKRIKNIRDIQLQAKKDAIAEKASEQALDYISIMEQDILKLDKHTSRLLKSEKAIDLTLAKTLIDTKAKLIDKQMQLTGMDKPERELEDQDVIVDGLLSKLGKSN